MYKYPKLQTKCTPTLVLTVKRVLRGPVVGLRTNCSRVKNEGILLTKATESTEVPSTQISWGTTAL